MKYSTIKIPAEDIEILKKMRKKFLKQGIDINSGDLVGSALELAEEEEEKLLNRIKTKEFNGGNKLLKELIAKPFEGKELTNSVKEHNCVF